MRLIDTFSLELKRFDNESAIPPYAILSHTWEENEVEYDEYVSWMANIRNKSGYAKIENSARIAETQGLRYLWIDTCCTI